MNFIISLFQQTLTPGDWPRHFEIDPAGKHILVTQEHTGTMEVYQISQSDAKLNLISTVPSNNKPSFVDFL